MSKVSSAGNRDGIVRGIFFATRPSRVEQAGDLTMLSDFTGP
jgi:hypothetical protein